jgi:hypothetical protein
VGSRSAPNATSYSLGRSSGALVALVRTRRMPLRYRVTIESKWITFVTGLVYMSRTMSVVGRAQQMSTSPSSGGSSGTGW